MKLSQISENKELMQCWDMVKNNKLGLNPEELTCGVTKKAHWICPECGKEEYVKIAHYYKRQYKMCKECAIKQKYNDRMKLIVKEQGSLADNYPQLVKEWDYEANGDLTPDKIHSFANNRVSWICYKGHKWNARINARTNLRTGCPICNKGTQTSLSENIVYYYIRQYFPDAIHNYRPDFLQKMELDIYIPSIKVGIEYDGVHYHKNKKDVIKNQLCKDNGIKLIRIREEGLDNLKDSVNLYIQKYNYLDLQERIMDILKMLNVENFKVDVLGNMSTLYNLEEFKEVKNSLAEMAPGLAEEFHPTKNGLLTADKVTVKSNKPIWWKCKKHSHEWFTSPNHRSKGRNCPICANKKVLVGYNDLATTHPKIAGIWDFDKNIIKPTEVVAGNNKRYYFKCNVCGQSWNAILNNVTNKGLGCPICSNHQIVSGINDAATLFPEIIPYFDTKNNVETLNTIAKTSGKKYNFICPNCLHHFSAPMNAMWRKKILKMPTLCPKCNSFGKKKKTKKS